MKANVIFFVCVSFSVLAGCVSYEDLDDLSLVSTKEVSQQEMVMMKNAKKDPARLPGEIPASEETV